MNEQTLKTLFSSKEESWATPTSFFAELDKEFHFTLDPCASAENHKCEKYFTKEQDGLKQDWKGYRVFCNPPYGRDIKRWVQKCHEESKHCPLIVMLVFARTDTQWFHDYVYGKAELRFIKGRLHFGDSKNAAPAPSMLVIYRKEEKQWQRIKS